MRIYLACTVRGERGGVLAGRAICDRLQQRGHEVLTTHLLGDDVDSAESQLTEAQVFRRDVEWLTRCDVLVASGRVPAPQLIPELKNTRASLRPGRRIEN